MRMLHLPLTILAVLAAEGRVRADEPPALLPPTQPIEQVVDHYIDQKLKEDNVRPAGPADDATLVRRLTLDLVGRIPTMAETRAYLESNDPAKKTQLVDCLMASPGFVRHLANELDAMLMAGSRTGLRDYLQKALAAGRNWDGIYRDLMLPDDKDPIQKGAQEFVRSRVADLDRLTADVSSLFFGVNVSCARCHDHPLVHDWKQDHFFGMKSFFQPHLRRGCVHRRARGRPGQVQDDQGRGKESPADVPDRQGGRRRQRPRAQRRRHEARPRNPGKRQEKQDAAAGTQGRAPASSSSNCRCNPISATTSPAPSSTAPGNGCSPMAWSCPWTRCTRKIPPVIRNCSTGWPGIPAATATTCAA